MESLKLVVIPALIGAVWFGLAAGAVAQLSDMGSAFATLRGSETSPPTSHAAPLVALATPAKSAQ
jgi:hypothetical protein